MVTRSTPPTQLIADRNPSLVAVPAGRPALGLAVTLEPFHMANAPFDPPPATRTLVNGGGIDPAARPGRRHEQGQPASQREQDGKERNRPAGMSGASVRRAVPVPGNGTKRARIGKASGYTHRSFRPDAVRYMSVTTATHRPTVTHPDTWRDKNETARRAAFSQRAGRFRRWWQVLCSNQRRLSRRFYSVPLLSTPYSS